MTYLRARHYYEYRYDKFTIETARRGVVHYDKFLTEFESKLPKGEKLDKPGNAFVVNVFYMQTVGNELIHRYEKREQTISEWMACDESLDERIANARLSEEPYCRHCGKQGLRIIDKSLMHRGENYEIDDLKEVLFMLKCPQCEKNSAFWEDGTSWKVKPTLCPKCNSDVTHKTSKTKKAITITYTCTSCKHSFKDRMDLSAKEEAPDPHFDEDRINYCLVDKEFRDRLFRMKHDFEGMAQLGKEMQEKRDNKHIYDAVKEIKKPKIAELIPLLSEPLEKDGYIEFHLDKPEMGREAYVGFSCLDSKSDRKDYDSRKTLKKLVDSALEDTNWRLMSDGTSYRLGYLNGRVRAYESEEDLKKLAMRSKNLKPKQTGGDATPKNNNYTIKGENGDTIIL
ncbi:hypothetical protein EOM60_00260 [Candidatus Saccharibacteria bacterium]|nr:hypothetical protein [Candidatus Saccharibacteria bacterium]